MPREKEDYRDNLVRLTERFPDREAIPLNDAGKILGCSTNTLLRDKDFPKKQFSGKWVVPIVGLARWLS